MLVDKYLTELGLLAKQLCPNARVEATTEAFEDEDGHLRVYPPEGVAEEDLQRSKDKLPTAASIF
jgi:hypothetical protein